MKYHHSEPLIVILVLYLTPHWISMHLRSFLVISKWHYLCHPSFVLSKMSEGTLASLAVCRRNWWCRTAYASVHPHWLCPIWKASRGSLLWQHASVGRLLRSISWSQFFVFEMCNSSNLYSERPFIYWIWGMKALIRSFEGFEGFGALKFSFFEVPLVTDRLMRIWSSHCQKWPSTGLWDLIETPW